MNNIFQVINSYHYSFESYMPIISTKSILVWSIFFLSFFSIIAFLYSFFWYLNIVEFPNITLNQEFKLITPIFFEVMALICFYSLQKEKNKLAKKEVQQKLKTAENEIVNLKRIWLEQKLNIPCSDFLSLAENIDSHLSLKQKYQSSFSINKERIANVIFCNDSKNRLLAMFMGISALVLTLSVAGGSSMQDVLTFFSGHSITQLIITDFLLAVLIIMSASIFYYILLISSTVFETFVDNLDGNNASSSRRARFFINQLLLYYKINEVQKERKRIVLRSSSRHLKNKRS